MSLQPENTQSLTFLNILQISAQIAEGKKVPFFTTVFQAEEFEPLDFNKPMAFDAHFSMSLSFSGDYIGFLLINPDFFISGIVGCCNKVFPLEVVIDADMNIVHRYLVHISLEKLSEYPESIGCIYLASDESIRLYPHAAEYFSPKEK